MVVIQKAHLLRGALLLVLSVFAGGVFADVSAGEGMSRQAKDFSLRNLNGEVVTLSELRGDNVVLLFGTTWCRHCQREMVLLEELCKRYGQEGTRFLFVAMRQKEDVVVDFYWGKAMTYDVLLDTDGIVSAMYGIRRVPTYVFIDAAGMTRFVGRMTASVAAKLISGQVVVAEDAVANGLYARDYMKGRPLPPDRARRFIVRLDEKPELSKSMPKAARSRRGAELSRMVERIGGRIIYNYGRWKNRIVVDIDPEKVERLRQLPGFKSVTEDKKVYALIADSAYQIRADYAWANAITGQGVNVCVVDTGIDYTHPDLINRVVKQYNFADGNSDAMDGNGHGTHVAGIIASQGLMYRGMSYDVALFAAKVLDDSGSGYESDVAAGIQWCVQEGADVINLSLGEGLYSETCDGTEMAQAVNEAVDAGVVVVCASGNDGNPDAIVSPACASKVIAVGSVDKIDSISSYSDGGVELDVVAPGGDQFGGENYPEIVAPFSTLVSGDPLLCMYYLGEQCYDNYFVVEGGRFIRAVGTSMAAPHVAGAAALLLEENPSLTPAQVKDVLEQSADDLGAVGWDNIYGWGRINVERALDILPAQVGELTIAITDPNIADGFTVGEQFAFGAQIDCLGGDGCGSVDVHAQFCEGTDCNDFVDLVGATVLSSADDNPVALGALSGITVETDAPILFDVATTRDVSERSYVKSVDPVEAVVGSTLPSLYTSDDLEEGDGLGAVGEDAEKVYEFVIPPGEPNSFKVKMENYLVLHFSAPPFAGWMVELSEADGSGLGVVGECIPAEGGGGETPPPDCWFATEDPTVLGQLNPGGTNHLRLSSFDVGQDDWLMFNNIYVIVEYKLDPDNDEVKSYYVKIDLSGIDPSAEVTAARLNVEVVQPAVDAVADVYLVDNRLSPEDSAELFHDAAGPDYSGMVNPIKSFACAGEGPVSINVKAAVDEALMANQESIAFSIRERGSDQVFGIGANGGEDRPVLTISQRGEPGGEPGPGGETPPQVGPFDLVYDTVVVKDVSEDEYSRTDGPASALIGSAIATEYSTGDLEPDSGIGAFGEDAEKVYEFEIPDGVVEEIRIRLENYLVLQWDDPPSGWYIFTSDPNGNEYHLIDDCIPISGGGGEPPPPDCWFVSSDPNVLADLNPGGVSYIKLQSHDVDTFDMLAFNQLEVIVRYRVDPDNDDINRYYMRFDVSSLAADSRIDSATLNLYVAGPGDDAVAQVNLVDSGYDPNTGAYTIYNAPDADYSSLTNPIKTFLCESTGLRRINVKAAVEDAVESGLSAVGFLITEDNENALFTLAGSDSANPPMLDIHLKSEISSGHAQWDVVSDEGGRFTLRVLAEASTGTTVFSDAVVIEVTDPDSPVIGEVDCFIGSQWQDCSEASYGDLLEKIRIEASDPQGTPQVHLKLKNVSDDVVFVDDDAVYMGGVFQYTADLIIEDSGQWLIEATVSDDDGNTASKAVTWDVPWGTLWGYLVDPNAMTPVVEVGKGQSFDLTVGVQCLDAECSDVSVRANLREPLQLKYDDGTAESYGEVGFSGGSLAVEFTPDDYPATLKGTRFYIWDQQTMYPFELHVWNDNGPDGAPGTDMIPPRMVKPVVPTSGDVEWFDIDLSDEDIVIDSGSFYIGWTQWDIERINQVGFDMDGTEYKRTWGSSMFGWLTLDFYCQFGFDDYCGNLMIRALLGDEQYYSDTLPAAPGEEGFYTTDEKIKNCGDLGAGQDCEQTFRIHAVGAVGQSTNVHAVFSGGYSFSDTGSVGITILQPASDCHAANLDAVGLVGHGDFAVFASQWPSGEPPLYADVNGDGAIGLEDVSMLAEHWLGNCQ